MVRTARKSWQRSGALQRQSTRSSSSNGLLTTAYKTRTQATACATDAPYETHQYPPRHSWEAGAHQSWHRYRIQNKAQPSAVAQPATQTISTQGAHFLLRADDAVNVSNKTSRTHTKKVKHFARPVVPYKAATSWLRARLWSVADPQNPSDAVCITPKVYKCESWRMTRRHSEDDIVHMNDDKASRLARCESRTQNLGGELGTVVPSSMVTPHPPNKVLPCTWMRRRLSRPFSTTPLTGKAEGCSHHA